MKRERIILKRKIVSSFNLAAASLTVENADEIVQLLVHLKRLLTQHLIYAPRLKYKSITP